MFSSHSPMTDCMDHVSYDRRDFNYNPRDHRHPLYLTDKHQLYHLTVDAQGTLISQRDRRGNPIRSPRCLRDLCLHTIAQDSSQLESVEPNGLPTNCYPSLLTEGIGVRDITTIEWCVSNWPMRVLRVYDVIPLEDYVTNDYLSRPLEGQDMSVADCIVLGLLKLTNKSHLRNIDLTMPETDRKLCKELCRLPILWMKPSERVLENIHSLMSESIDVSKDKTRGFLNRISRVYYNVDGDFSHGNKIDTVTIHLDLKMDLDDVPLGLSLQQNTPFKFSCNRLWMKHIDDVYMPPANLARVLDLSRITQFEFEESLLPYHEDKLRSLLDGLASLRNLQSLSLPNSIDTLANQTMMHELSDTLRRLTYLHRINVSHCNIKGKLSELLDGLSSKVTYLNLTDTRLTFDDMTALSEWRGLSDIRELNLSCNNLSELHELIIAILQRVSHITCLSLSYCQLAFPAQLAIVRECKENSYLKVLCLQDWTPPPIVNVFDILLVCCQIPSLQKVLMFPEVYAFPGFGDRERIMNRFQAFRQAYLFMDSHGGEHLNLE